MNGQHLRVAFSSIRGAGTIQCLGWTTPTEPHETTRSQQECPARERRNTFETEWICFCGDRHAKSKRFWRNQQELLLGRVALGLPRSHVLARRGFRTAAPETAVSVAPWHLERRSSMADSCNGCTRPRCQMRLLRGRHAETVTENGYQLNVHGVGKCKPLECARRLMMFANIVDVIIKGGAGQEVPRGYPVFPQLFMEGARATQRPHSQTPEVPDVITRLPCLDWGDPLEPRLGRPKQSIPGL